MFNDLEFPGSIPSKKGQKMVIPEHKKLFIPVEQPYPDYRLEMQDPQRTVSMVGVQGDKAAYFISTENATDSGFSFPENKDSLHEPQLWLSANHGLWGQKRTLYIGITKNEYADIVAWYNNFATERGWKLPPLLGKEKKQYIVKILPNPASDLINVNFDRPLSEKTVLLVQDVNGKNLLTEILESGSDTYQFKVDNFTAGLYQIYLFYSSGHHQAMRFVKN
jgi:Secretion system C-terminal sorting domain